MYLNMNSNIASKKYVIKERLTEEDVNFTNLIKDEKLNHVIFQLENWRAGG